MEIVSKNWAIENDKIVLKIQYSDSSENIRIMPINNETKTLVQRIIEDINNKLTTQTNLINSLNTEKNQLMDIINSFNN